MNRTLLGRPVGKRPKIFYGWWIVGIGMVLDALRQGTFNTGFAVYFLPVQRDLGLSRAAISLVFSLGRLESSLEGPVTGYLIDRMGPRIMMVAGGVLAGTGFILLAFTNSFVPFVLIFVLILTLGFRMGFNNGAFAAVNTWFRRKKGLAMSLVSMGHGLGAMVITPLVGLAVVTWGWRPTALISGAVVLSVAIPLSLLVRPSPESMGLLPDGSKPGPETATDANEAVAVQESTSPPRDFSTREALRTPSYWHIVLANGLRHSVHGGIIVHMVPLMVWAGRSEREAAFLIGLMALCTLVLRPIMGWTADRWSKQRVAAMGVGIGGIAPVMIIVSTGQLWQLLVFVFLLAFSESVNSLVWAVLGEFFGRQNFATIKGWESLMDGFIAMGTPVFMGWVFDQTNSYLWAVVPLIPAYAVSAPLFWTLRPPPERLPGLPAMTLGSANDSQ